MAFNPFTGLINSDFIDLHANAITELVTACTVPCKLLYGKTKWEDCPNCWESGTLIQTEYGFKRIEDVIIGEMVYTGPNQLNKVIDKRSRVYEGEMVRIVPHYIDLPYRVTADHKFPIIRNFRQYYSTSEWHDSEFELNVIDKLEEVSACNITTNDAILIPFASHSTSELQVWYDYELDDDLLYLFGWWIAEGCLHIKKYTRSGSFCLRASTETNVALTLKRILKNKFNINSRLEYRKNSDNLLLTWNSSWFAKLMMDFGHLAVNKHIPNYLWKRLSIRQKLVLFNAYWQGDGHEYHDITIGQYHRRSVSTISPLLALQSFNILLSSGFIPSIRYNSPRIDKNGTNHQMSFVVTWSKKRRVQPTNLRKCNLGWLAKVRKIVKEHDKCVVHNLKVENVHRYIAGAILTNNCNFDAAIGRSSNRYQSGGPIPFSTGVCPYCNGAGKIGTEITSTINLAIIYNYKDWIDLGIEIRSPNGFVQSLSLLKTLDELKEAKELIVDTDISKYVNQRFERYGEPQPCGFSQATIIATMWKRIEN